MDSPTFRVGCQYGYDGADSSGADFLIVAFSDFLGTCKGAEREFRNQPVSGLELN